MQNLNVNLTIEIPEEYVLIKKIELEQLKSEANSGVWWSMKDIEKRINKKRNWIQDNILYPTRFKKILDVKQGGFVYYPESQGERWVFQASKMTEFLEKYFTDIFTKQ